MTALAVAIGVIVICAGIWIAALRARIRDLRRDLVQARQRHDAGQRELTDLKNRFEQTENRLGEVAAQGLRLRERHEKVMAETEHLRSVRIPALLTRLRHPHIVVPGPASEDLAGSALGRAHQEILEAIAHGVQEERELVDGTAQGIVRAAMSRVQALALRAQDLLNDVQQRYGDDARPELVRALLALDKHNELTIGRVQTTAIACGAPTGLSRDDTYLVDLTMGAIARVENFEHRIDRPVNNLRRRVGVAARAAEPVLFIVANLLANAVHFTNATMKIAVTLHESDTGALIIIDDAGVGLNEEQYARAHHLLEGKHPVLLSDLGNPPRTGWAAIGRLVAEHGVGVSVQPSPFGGVRAVLNVPAALLVEMPEGSRPSAVAPEPVRSRSQTPPRAEPAAAIDGLPQRVRRAPAQRTGSPVGGAASISPEEARTAWTAYQAGAEAGRRDATLTRPPSHPVTDPEGN
ncbi:hypothetical protein Misp01_31560 [Microtetraspora sp. NBRC 13810]|nr:hypothetical protein Misp01_31560 [Microtetraspora sp. NBRC 13810]